MKNWYKVNDNKGRCLRLGSFELIVNGSLYNVSIEFGRYVVLLFGQKK
jgi:hypothetical protein